MPEWRRLPLLTGVRTVAERVEGERVFRLLVCVLRCLKCIVTLNHEKHKLS